MIFVLGGLFGLIIQYAGLNRYDVISGQSGLKDNTVIKTILMAIGVGAILLSVIIGLGWASFHVKPFVLGGVALGGLIFGSGMALLGYCPGTLPISAGEGSLDAWIGIAGGLLGGWVYTLLVPHLQWLRGPDFGKISLHSMVGDIPEVYYAVAAAIGVFFILLAVTLNKRDNTSDRKWWIAGILLAVLNAIVFLHGMANRPIGASTSYPYLADWLGGTTDNAYFDKIQKPGHWEMIFLFGAMLAAFVVAVLRKRFRLRLIHSRWEKYKGNRPGKRIFWAFAGGFILIFGARTAGGCTSGHILSGGMQLAAGSLVFTLFVFAGLVLTGKGFYRKEK